MPKMPLFAAFLGEKNGFFVRAYLKWLVALR
jgi:hypothetical protein